MGKYAKRATVLMLAMALAMLSTPASLGAPGTGRDFTFTQFGKELGTVRVELMEEDCRRLKTEVHLAAFGVEAHSEFVFSGTSFPMSPREYAYWIQAPNGRMDFSLKWEEEIKYNIPQLGRAGVLVQTDVLPIDNNILSDYQILTWGFDTDTRGKQQTNIVVPAASAQAVQVIPATTEFIREEKVGQYDTLAFRSVVGGQVEITLWVDKVDRLLVKMVIPAQGVEVAALGLENATSSGQASTEKQTGKTGKEPEIREFEVSIPVEGGFLSGTLVLPTNPSGRVPGVVFVSGSGPTDRDGNNPLLPGEINNIKEIAYYLGRHGIASLRYDKRGVAKSGSAIKLGETPSFDMFVADASKAVEFLRLQEGLDGDRIYIVGHSEGALIATLVASRRDDLAGAALLAGPGYSLAETIRRQLLQQAKAFEEAGMGSGLSAKISKALDDLYAAISGDEPFDLSAYDLPSGFLPVFQSLNVQREFAKSYLYVDPLAEVAMVNCPLLIVQGDTDSQVTVEDARRLASVPAPEGSSLHVLKDVDHVLKPTPEGKALPYGDPSRRVSQELLEILLKWIQG